MTATKRTIILPTGPHDMALLTVSKQAVGKMQRPRAKSAKLPPPFTRGRWASWVSWNGWLQSSTKRLAPSRKSNLFRILLLGPTTHERRAS
jgi:hypothetical protein